MPVPCSMVIGLILFYSLKICILLIDKEFFDIELALIGGNDIS